MRIGIIALLHESNTFLPAATTLQHFADNVLGSGSDCLSAFVAAQHEVGGFWAGLAEAGVTAVPVFAARAVPYGTITAEAWAELQRQLESACLAVGPLDGWLVAPHGATVAASAPDADGAWLTALRARVGPSVPIVGTLDLHANVSVAMCAATDALIAYRTNPHLDQRARGLEAAALLVRTVRGEVQPRQVCVRLPLVVNIERQLVADEPCRSLFAYADALRTRPGILSVSVLLGFPYADVAEMGASVIVVADADADLAQRTADELAGWWWAWRTEFVDQLLAPALAVQQAAALTGLVGLLDMGDNVGGGGPGDGTWLLHELRAARVQPSLAVLYDPNAVAHATAAGVGATLALAVGGHTDDRHGPPLVGQWRVHALHPGQFTESEARHGGYHQFDQGPTAILVLDEALIVIATTLRMAPFSVHQLLGLWHSLSVRAVVIKGVHAPVAAYAPICSRLLRVNTPGATSADLTQFVYHHRRRPMFPLEPDTVRGEI